MFTLLEVGFLLSQVDHDFRRAGHLVPIPIAHGRRQRKNRPNRARGSLLGGFKFFAARNEPEQTKRYRKLYEGLGVHRAADSNVASVECNSKSLGECSHGALSPCSGSHQPNAIVAMVVPTTELKHQMFAAASTLFNPRYPRKEIGSRPHSTCWSYTAVVIEPRHGHRAIPGNLVITVASASGAPRQDQSNAIKALYIRHRSPQTIGDTY